MDAETLKRMLGITPEPQLTIVPDYDPEAIRDGSLFQVQLKEETVRKALFIIIPILFGIGLSANVFDIYWLGHTAATVLFGGLLGNLLLNLFAVHQIKFLEEEGRFVDLAEMVFLSPSPYWTTKEMLDNPKVLTAPIATVILILIGTFALGWYFTMAFAAFCFVIDVGIAKYFRRQGRALVAYKEQWEKTEGAKRRAMAEAERKRQKVVDELLAEEEQETSEAFDTAMLDDLGIRRPNALGPDGPEYIPEDLQGKDVIDPEDADRIINIPDDDGDSHIRGG